MAASDVSTVRVHCGLNPYAARAGEDVAVEKKITAKIIKKSESSQAGLIFFHIEVIAKMGQSVAYQTELFLLARSAFGRGAGITRCALLFELINQTLERQSLPYLRTQNEFNIILSYFLIFGGAFGGGFENNNMLC